MVYLDTAGWDAYCVLMIRGYGGWEKALDKEP